MVSTARIRMAESAGAYRRHMPARKTNTSKGLRCAAQAAGKAVRSGGAVVQQGICEQISASLRTARRRGSLCMNEPYTVCGLGVQKGGGKRIGMATAEP